MFKNPPLILTKRKCEECAGYGVLTDARWAHFYRHLEQAKIDPAMQETEATIWFPQQGYPTHNTIPEEVACSECQGTGYKEEWESLLSLIKEVEQLTR
jgi:hypothetical protein